MPFRRKSSRKPRRTVNTGAPRRRVVLNPPRRRAPRRQARFNVSSSQYRINRAISKAMSRMSETKLLATSNINATATNGTPTAVISSGSPAIAQVTAWRGVLASVPANWDTGLNNLGGIFTTAGLEGNQHVGNYIYFKKTHMTFQIDMTFTTAAAPPIQFRLIVCKARQAVTPAGTTEYPQNTLFLKSDGSPTGHAGVAPVEMNSFEIMNQPLNRRDWVVMKDQRFTLSHPMRSMPVPGPSATDPIGFTPVGYSGKYPNRKNFTLNLPHYAKTRLSKDGHPTNYDSRYLVYIYATSIGAASAAPDQWTVSSRGTTSFTDN